MAILLKFTPIAVNQKKKHKKQWVFGRKWLFGFI